MSGVGGSDILPAARQPVPSRSAVAPGRGRVVAEQPGGGVVGPGEVDSVQLSGVGTPRTEAQVITDDFNQMLAQSGSRARLSSRFTERLAAHIGENGGKIDLVFLHQAMIDDLGKAIDDDEFHQSAFLQLFGGKKEDGKAFVSLETFENRMNFYKPILATSANVRGEGFLQVMQDNKIEFVQLDTENSMNYIDITSVAGRDSQRYQEYLEQAWSQYVNEAGISDSEKKLRKMEAYLAEQSPNAPLPSQVEKNLFYIYYFEFQKYCEDHNIKFDGVDFKNPSTREKFFKGVFANFVETGAVEHNDTNGSAWNWLLIAREEKFYINTNLIESQYQARAQADAEGSALLGSYGRAGDGVPKETAVEELPAPGPAHDSTR